MKTPGYNEENVFSFRRLYDRNGPASITEKILVALLCFFILASPLPFGSVTPLPLFVIEIISAICFLIWATTLLFLSNTVEVELFRTSHRDRNESFHKSPFFYRKPWCAKTLRILTAGKWPAKNRAENLLEEDLPHLQRPDFFCVFGYPVKNTGLEKIALTFLAFILFQLIPLPDIVMAILASAARQYYQTAAALVGVHRNFFPISVDPFVTFDKFLEFTSYFLIYLVVVNVVRRSWHRKMLLMALFLAAGFQATYGLYEFISGHQHIFAYQKKFDRGSVTGTFINHNHFAAYLELTIPLLIAYMIVKMKTVRVSGRKLSIRIARALEDQGSQVLLLSLFLILFVVALIFSFSRSGIVFGFGTCFAFFYFYRRKRGAKISSTYWILSAAVIFGLAVWIGLGPVVSKFMELPAELTSDVSRPTIWKDTFFIFLHFPVAGSGIGTFKEVFPAYRSFSIDTTYSQAHNDYLQLLAEGGFLMVFLIMAIFFVLIRRLKEVTDGRINKIMVIQIASFCSLLAITLHSFSDFSLQIPAIAATTAIIGGLYFSDAYVERQKL